MENRREFLKKGAAMALATAFPLSTLSAKPGKIAIKKIKLKSGMRILFQGDSVTDSGRTDPNIAGLGYGYVRDVAAMCAAQYSKESLEILNRGINGHRVPMLQERWQRDAIELQPDVLSILIGINDYWHSKIHGYQGTIETYEENYRKLLQDTKRRLPNIILIIGEPFAVHGVGHAIPQWKEELPAYQAVAQKLAKEFGAYYIPFQTLFNNAVEGGAQYGFAPDFWAQDGVHPSAAGHVMMANAIMRLFQ